MPNFVDFSFIQKRSDDLSTSHHPNLLTGLRADGPCEIMP